MRTIWAIELLGWTNPRIRSSNVASETLSLWWTIE